MNRCLMTISFDQSAFFVIYKHIQVHGYIPSQWGEPLITPKHLPSPLSTNFSAVRCHVHVQKPKRRQGTDATFDFRFGKRKKKYFPKSFPTFVLHEMHFFHTIHAPLRFSLWIPGAIGHLLDTCSPSDRPSNQRFFRAELFIAPSSIGIHVALTYPRRNWCGLGNEYFFHLCWLKLCW